MTDLSPGFGGAPAPRGAHAAAAPRRRNPHAETADALAHFRGEELVGLATPQRRWRWRGRRRLEASGSRVPGLQLQRMIQEKL